jgi:hypothetical protein
MLAQAGIQIHFRINFKNSLDSRVRGYDGKKSRLAVNEFRTPRLGAEGRSVISVKRVARVAMIAIPSDRNTSAKEKQ